MSGSRIIVLVLILALSLSGWAGQAKALGDVPFDVPANTGSSDGHAKDAECPSAAKAHHDHSHGDDGTDCCHLMAPALELYSPSAYQTSWDPVAGFLQSYLESITGIIVSPVLRPPRV